MRTPLLVLSGLLALPPVRGTAVSVAALGRTDPVSREYAYTDKDSAYWYGRTREAGNDWFSGWNVATERIFQDYRVFIDGQLVDRATAQVTVYPHELVRRYPWGEETFALFDHHRVLSIKLKVTSGRTIGIELTGDQLQPGTVSGGVLSYGLAKAPGRVLAVTTLRPAAASRAASATGIRLEAPAAAGGFLIALESSLPAATATFAEAQKQNAAWSDERQVRMNRLLADNVLQSDDPTVDAALAWNLLSLDSLVTRQTGQGIYAGLPWFNDYWGRDMFISLPGTCLVTGQLATAADILRSFARYQNTDEASRDFGRVPNRLRPDDIIYNTTDGTPRFVIALRDYVRYSGDAALAHELYPAVQRAINGALRHWVDVQGYLTHDDADTWMDARWEGKTPWSPRGNRANDIQALWQEELLAGIGMASDAGDTATALRWAGVAQKLQANFARDFLKPDGSMLADRLRVDGTADFTIRPNQLFALDLIPSWEDRARLTRNAWEALVYPWGVASLSQEDPHFHPWQENATYLHKDEAYHNGTVWLWNNGIAIDRMIEAGQPDLAFALFQNMAKQSIASGGAVGTLSELNDALPRPGHDGVAPAGTFSQAWSSAEFVRVWYQSFLGIQPDVVRHTVKIAPRLPAALKRLDFTIPLAGGRLHGRWERTKTGERYRYALDAAPAVTLIDLRLAGFARQTVTLAAGEELVAVRTGNRLQLDVTGKDGTVRSLGLFAEDLTELARLNRLSEIMRGVSFARPHLNPALESLQPDHAAKLKKELDAKAAEKGGS